MGKKYGFSQKIFALMKSIRVLDKTEKKYKHFEVIPLSLG